MIYPLYMCTYQQNRVFFFKIITYCLYLLQKRTSNSPDLFNMMSGSNNNTTGSGGVAHSTSNSNLNEMEDIEITGTFERFLLLCLFILYQQ